MIRYLSLGWVLIVGGAWAQSPMDLDSPFAKVALVRNSIGSVKEKEVKDGKRAGGQIEFVTQQGGVLLVPVGDVVAVLPKLPEPGLAYGLKDLDTAIRFLETLPEEFKSRPEGSAETLQAWKDLRKPAEEAEARRDQEAKVAEDEKARQNQALVMAWSQKVTDLSKPRSEEDWASLRKEGEKLLDSQTGNEAMVRDGLAWLAQIKGNEKGRPLPELTQLDQIQAKLVPDEALVWATAGILFVSLFGFLIGTGFVSSGLTRLREGALLGGMVFGGLGAVILAASISLWWPEREERSLLETSVSPGMGQLILFAKNSVQPVYFFPSREFRFPAPEFAGGILGALAPAEESVGLFKGRLKPGKLWLRQSRFYWKQPVTAMGIPLPVSYIFEGPIPRPEAWLDFTTDKVSVGRWAIPEPFGSVLSQGMKATVQAGLQAAGFSSMNLKAGSGDALIVMTAASGKRPHLVRAGPAAAESVYRRNITAEDLAKAFAENKGYEFKNKFVLIEGFITKVSSGSEFSGVQSAGAGNASKNKKNAKISEDAFDVFYLEGMKTYGARNDPLLIKLIIKSPDVFVMDAYGDIYKGPNVNIVKEKPFIKKGYRVKFLKEGRVQTGQVKNNEIEVYGIEVDGEGDIDLLDPSQPSGESI